MASGLIIVNVLFVMFFFVFASAKLGFTVYSLQFTVGIQVAKSRFYFCVPRLNFFITDSR
jgi:hypothetical protein